MNNNEMFALKCQNGKMLDWNVSDFELIKSGKKGGRPNWEVEHHEAPHTRFAFTAFDTNDIDELHKVQC